MNQLEDVAYDFVQLFEQLNIPYALMGGFAVRTHAIPRPTYDVDFTITLPHARLPELYAAAKERGYEIPEAQETGWIESVKGLSLVKFKWYTTKVPGSFDIDVFLAENAFHKQMIARRQRHAYGCWEAWFVSPEDLILLKVFADRMKDKVDVIDILFTKANLTWTTCENGRSGLTSANVLNRLLINKIVSIYGESEHAFHQDAGDRQRLCLYRLHLRSIES